MLDALIWGTAISALISGIASAATNSVAARVFKAVRNRFADDSDATRDLERARYHPHDPAALRELDRQLERYAREDPRFRRQLDEATTELAASGVSAQQSMGNADIHGSAVQIGRDNRGGITIGTPPPAEP